MGGYLHIVLLYSGNFSAVDFFVRNLRMKFRIFYFRPGIVVTCVCTRMAGYMHALSLVAGLFIALVVYFLG